MRQPPIASVESLPKRQHLTGVLDSSWAASQPAIDAAAGQALTITRQVATATGRTYLLASGSDGGVSRTYLVALDDNGRPDASFGGSGIVATPFAGGTASGVPVEVTVGFDSAVYVRGLDDTRLFRYSTSGRRDRTFGQNGFVSLPRNLADTALVPGLNGGVLGVTVDQRDVGIVAFDNGPVRTVFNATGNANQSAVRSPVLTAAGGGYALAFAQQPAGNGDAVFRVERLTSAFATRWSRDISISPNATIDALVPEGGSGAVRLVPTDTAAHRRLIRVTASGVVRRSFIDLPEAALARQSVTYLGDGRIIVGGAERGRRTGQYVPVLSVLNADGQIDRSFGRRGVFRGDAVRNDKGFVQINQTGGGALLISRIDRTAAGNSLATQRLFLSSGPLAYLVGVRLNSPSAGYGVLTVRYRAPSGIEARTIDRRDLSITNATGLRLLDATTDGTAVTARYRFSTTSIGATHNIAVLADQIGSGDELPNGLTSLGALVL